MRFFPRLLAGFLLLAAFAMADIPTVQNNDFEMPAIGPPFVSLVDVPGWFHTGSTGIGNLIRDGYADGIGSVGAAGHGKQFLLLGSGPGGFHGDATWSTDITGLTPGTTYSLGFLMASQLPRVATTVTVSLMSGSSTPAQSFMVSPFALAYWGTWESKQMTFLATAAKTKLVFSIVEQGSELGLDYVTIAVAAPPVLTPSVTSINLPINNGLKLASGAPMLITGANLGTGPSDVASVTVGGESAPVVSFLSPSSLLAQVPVDLAAGPATVTVTHQGMTTAPFPVTVAAFSPAIYYPGTSAFADSGGTPITLSHLAIPGSKVSCTAIGLGPTNPPMLTGVPAAAAAPTTAPVQVMVGTQMVTADFAGLQVGSVTDYQVTFRIPMNTPDAAQPVTISVGGATSNTVSLLVGVAVPQIDAIVNGASFQAGPGSPNEFVSLFGSSFGSEDTLANIFPATSFGAVSVLINGGKVPLYFVSGAKSQINIVLPSGLDVTGSAFVEVTNAQGVSAAYQLGLTQDNVGIFRIADPSNPARMNGAVLFSNSAWKVMPLSMAAALGFPACASVTKASVCGQPAKVGDQVQIYLTGLGRATSSGDTNGKLLPTGSLAPSDGSVLYKTVVMPVVTIGGIAADVSFSGIAPGSAGEFQINVAIPNGVEPGDDVKLTVSMQDGSSDTVTIAVRG